MAEDFPEIMNIAEVCRYLRIPRSSLYKLAQEGKIPGQKVGRHWRFRRKSIDQWLGQMPRQQAEVSSTLHEEDLPAEPPETGQGD